MVAKRAAIERIDVLIEGPQQLEYGTVGELEMEVTVSVKRTAFMRDTTRFVLRTTKWPTSGPMIQPWRVKPVGTCDVDELEELAHDLRAYFRYVEKLPVQPRTVPDHLAALLAHFKATPALLHVGVWKKRHDRAASVTDDQCSTGRVYHLCAEAWKAFEPAVAA